MQVTLPVLERVEANPISGGFTSHWVTPAEFWGPTRPLPATAGLGRGERESWQAALPGRRGRAAGTGAFAFFPVTAGFASGGGSLTPAWCSEEASAVLAPRAMPTWGASKGGRKTSFLPPLAPAELRPHRIPAGHLPGKFSLFLGELSLASC